MPEQVCLTLPYARYPFERALDGIAAAGFRAIGFGLPHAGVPVPEEQTPAEAKRIRSLCDRYGLGVSLLYGAQVMREDVEQLCRRVDFAREVGASLLMWVGTWGYRQFPDEPLSPEAAAAAHRDFLARIRPVAEYAAASGVVLTFKPHTGNTATGPILARTLRDIGVPGVRACYDPGNVHFYEGIAPEDDVRPVLAETAALVMKDHRGPRANPDFPIPGEGEVDFVRILRDLRGAGFDGPVIVERIDGADRGPIAEDEIDRRLQRAYANVGRMLREAGFGAAATA